MVILIVCESNARVCKKSTSIKTNLLVSSAPYKQLFVKFPKKIGAKTTAPRLHAHIQDEIRNFLGPVAFQDSSWGHWHTLVFDAFG